MTEILIKVGNVKIEATEHDLAEVHETSEGVVFIFKGGLSVHYSNNYMPSSAKQIVKQTADNVKGKRKIFQLDNPKRVAVVEAN